jgi:hypothetical protein
LKENSELQSSVEEILVTLYFKNTGPIAGQDVNLSWGILTEDYYTTQGQLNPTSKINMKADFSEMLKKAQKLQEEETNFTSFIPEQEETIGFMINRKQWGDQNVWRRDTLNTNHIFLLCRINYKSITGAQHGYFGVYRLFHTASHTRIYYAIPIISEIH